MAHKYQYLRPSQVILDRENPRLPDGTSSDREAINLLLEDDAEDLVALARDMARSGQTNPAELPIAIKSGSKYLVLEGNRRFAALKLMSDPDLADDEAHQKSFRRAVALGSPPKSVFTLVASSREEADYWIVLRHTGENNGRGVKRWSAGQSATHRRRNNKSVDSGTARAMAIVDELREAYATDTEMIEMIGQASRDKLTNIGRFFSPDVLDRLHFSIQADGGEGSHGRRLLVHHSRDALRPFLWWAFSFILDKSVDSYKNKDIRAAVLRSVGDLLPRDSDASPHPFRLAGVLPEGEDRGSSLGPSSSETEEGMGGAGDGAASHSGLGGGASNGDGASSGGSESGGHQSVNSPSTDPSQSGGRPRGKSEAKPEKYLLQGLKLPNHPYRLQKLLRECRTLDVEEVPGVACVMMRILVELSVSSSGALALSGAQERDSLKKKIMAMLRFLDPRIEDSFRRDKSLEQAYLDVSSLGMEYLNGFVHNPDVNPDPHLARRFSAAFRPFLERVDGAL
ncbi:hypothetical protein [Micromonospora sp. HUAS LYJ1]|uniref:hypothetical protein n=1 Tax=Micromonospora sp. HUAS LYJ1 TaxID=3061626 RepID=UPI002672ADFA|nr:hypothetical protein [Micromonospora sp. HUAS LYJ1]WKU03141.1 hypothetical protein Q2K16_19925 [Micromonospora sp. HUAS LYJ1]